MTLYYSATTRGFYDSQIHEDKALPADAVEITAEEHQALLQANARGDWIEPDETGYPQAVFPSPDEALATIKEMALNRLAGIAQSQRQQVAGTHDEMEIAGWLNKFRMAQAWRLGTATQAEQSALEMERAARALNESMEDFCDDVFKRGGQLIKAIGVIDGLKHQARQAVHQVNNQVEVDELIKDFNMQLNAVLVNLEEAT